MTSPRLLSTILLACLWLIAACGPSAPEQPAASENVAPVAVVEATATPLPSEPPAPTATSEPAPVAAEPTATTQPVAEPAPTATPEPEADWTQTASLVDGLYVRGNPNAPIRLVDYSDFF